MNRNTPHRCPASPRLLQQLRFGPRRLAGLAIAACFAASASFALPQDGSPTPQQPSRLLADAPVVIEELGVSIRPPAKAALSRERGADGQPTVTIADTSPAPIWQIRVQALIPELENPTPELLIQDHIGKLKGAGHDLQILSSKEVMVGETRGWQAFMSDMHAEEPLVNGYLIVPGQGPPFIVISFVCTMLDFPRMRPTLEASLASVRLDSPQRIADEREAKLNAGAALLETFDSATLRNLIGLDQWFRHYRPASAGQMGGDIEIGVSHITVREGKRGELNVERDPAKYDASESQTGLLLSVQARIVLDSERDLYYDSLAMYWMSWDDTVEAWSIVASRKHKGNAISEAETGFRLANSPGEPNGILQIVKSGVEGAQRAPKQWTLPEFYLSQPIAWLLGHLMASNNAPAGEYSFYAYDSALGSLSIRRDTWEPKPGGNGAGTLTTHMHAQAPPVTAEYDSDGKLVRRTRPDGSMTVPSTVAEIRRLWEAKNLKLGSTN